MKIVVIGANGIIGQSIVAELKEHEVVKVGHSKGNYRVDIEDRGSIKAMLEKVGQVDAVVSATGNGVFASIEELTFDQIKAAINSKLLGQINIFQIGRAYVREGGSITLTSGVLAQHPMRGGSALSLVNGAIESFVKATAFELDHKLRLNAVSPHFVKETMDMMDMDSTSGISASDTAKAYRHAVLTKETGQTFDVADYI
ncbi:short chain dehydrogenase [Microbulbifer sp. THAF38]|uniref:short chain dehydrogenase n=1 Tax=Microbulbifer sp. THAF38 TaxID=2587856 RepID=UPI001267D5AE|nr:short chain dehydrogenase [Microbulbifer sp. THAF38]QFT54851.1 short chain dehydrogenase [Microbulbifer sp. THAF38]